MKRREWLQSGLALTASTILPRADGYQENTVDEAAALRALFATEWDYVMERNPTWASTLGDRRWNDRWDDLSLGAIASDHQHDLEVLRKLESIDRNRLSPTDRTNYDLFQKAHATAVEEHPFHWYLIPLNQRGGIQTADEQTDSLRFETSKDYQDWIARLQAFSTYVDQTMSLMRQGMVERMMLPRVIMRRITPQIDKQIVNDPEASPFYRAFRTLAKSIPEASQSELRRAARAAVEFQVVPSFRRFRTFYVEQYLPACYEQVGIWQLPRGEEMYAAFVRRHTTTSLTPQEIHQRGLSEVARIRTEMEGVLKDSGFRGTMPEFFQFLRTDPQFYEKTPQDLLRTYRATAKRIDPQLVKLFRTLPRQPYGVEPIPDAVAPDTTAAYYSQGAADGSRAGTFYVNLYKPEARPTWEIMALSLHESVPGHHLQIALGMEQGELPNFRRYGYYDAFGEGWGLYAESLGEEMGLYDNSYSRFGRLTYEMWRAVRLVVDTGMHFLRWDRQRAIDYFMQNAAKQELDVTNEVDRYIAWPGQALAYKIGELKFKELRAHALQNLGSKFDIREFHDVVLREGALPLDILQQNVEAWVASKG